MTSFLLFVLLCGMLTFWFWKFGLPECLVRFLAPVTMWSLTFFQRCKRLFYQLIKWGIGKFGLEMIMMTEATLEKGFLIIPYVLRGTKYFQRVPYHIRNGRSGYRFIGCNENMKVDFQHHPGLECYFTPQDLGYDKVIIVDASDSEVKSYELDEKIKI